MTVVLGQPVPEFKATATSNKDVLLSALEGYNVVLYFYPKDSTPGCTTEGQDFRDNYDVFKTANTVIFGVSRDSLKSHENFKSKQDFPFELIADPDETLCKLFDVIKLKNMYGKQVMGIERSTFVINKKGYLHKEWRRVSVAGHVQEVLSVVTALNQSE